VASAPNADAARRILRARSRLGARIENGTITLELDALSVEDRERVDQQKLASSLLAEFDVESITSEDLDPLSFDVKPDNAVQTERVSKVLNQIKVTGRQEERIAILVDAILQHRDVGLSALIQYGNDRAKLANWAIQEMRGRLGGFGHESPKLDEAAIAEFIPRLFNNHYTLSRGELLFYLAKHLAKWPTVNAALRRTLDRTASVFVGNYRKKIEELLDKPIKQS
jgi:hypothetical protein